jgi:hypothetical protein
MAVALAVAILAWGSAARADVTRCPAPSDRFAVLRGDLAPGRTCGTLIVTTDASDTPFYLGAMYRYHSVAKFAWPAPVRAPFEVTLEWQFVTPGRWALELDGLGAMVILSRDRLGFFLDDAQMLGTMFAELPGVGGPGRRTIVVRRTATEIVVAVDGKDVGRKTVAASGPGNLVVGLRGAPGHRSRAELRSFTVRALAATP